MKKNFALLLILLRYSCSFAQQTGKISGKVVENKQAIEFASISLAKLPDSTKILYSTPSDSLGNFRFERAPFGAYVLKISLIGYKTYQKHLNISESNLNLGEIELQTDTKLLNEVQVTAQKKLIEKKKPARVLLLMPRPT